MTYTKLSFQSLAVTLLLAVAPSAAANTLTPLPDIPADQIAQDIERRQNPQTGAIEYYAPSFDPFESVDNIVGTVSLRSNTRSDAISGNILRGGALLDINFFYSTESDDPYDVAGFESAVFFSGEDVQTTYYDNRIIECSSNVHETVYEKDYYTGASFGLIGGIYRPFPRYRGHRFFGTLGYSGFGWSFPVGIASNRRFSNRNRFNRSRGVSSRNRFTNRGRFTSPNRTRNRNNIRRNNDDINSRRRTVRRNLDDRRDDNSRRINREERRDNLRNFTREERRDIRQTRRDDGQARSRDTANADKRRVRRSGLNTIKGEASQSRQSRRTVSPRTTAAASERVQTRQNISKRTSQRPSTVKQPKTAVKAQSIKSSTPRKASSNKSSSAKRSVKSESQRSNNKSSSRSSNRSSNRSTNRNQNRSSNRSVRKSSNRSFRSSQPSNSRRKLNFFPQTSLFGASTYRTSTVSVSQRCAREENLVVHISRDRLEAAQYDGLTIFVLDRDGQDIPVYIPPNYIQGFGSVAFGQAQSYQEPRGYFDQNQDQGFSTPQNPSSEPRIYGDPNAVQPLGRFPQPNDGF